LTTPDNQRKYNPHALEGNSATVLNSAAMHLGEDQFTALALIGSGDAAAIRAGQFDRELEFEPDSGIGSATLAHLAACPPCREELARFTESLVSFNHLSLAWADSRPARPMVVHTTLLGHLRGSWLPRAAWAFAVCTLLVALFFGSPRLNRDKPTGAPSTQDSDAQIANDNQLMDRVTLELSRPERSPAAEYGIGATPQPSAARSHKVAPRSNRPESRLD